MAIISRASVTPPKHPLTDAGSDGEDPLLRNLEYSDSLLAPEMINIISYG